MLSPNFFLHLRPSFPCLFCLSQFSFSIERKTFRPWPDSLLFIFIGMLVDWLVGEKVTFRTIEAITDLKEKRKKRSQFEFEKNVSWLSDKEIKLTRWQILPKLPISLLSLFLFLCFVFCLSLSLFLFLSNTLLLVPSFSLSLTLSRSLLLLLSLFL